MQTLLPLISVLLLLLAGAAPEQKEPAQQPEPATRPARPLFATAAEACLSCHNGLTAPSGEDISIGTQWRASMMANAARDPYWQAAVRREVLDHPKAQAAIENECSACHMPMTRYEAKVAGRHGEVFAHLPIPGSGARADLLAADGVSCTTCHQIGTAKLGTRESFTAGFAVDTTQPFGGRIVFGPFQVDGGRTRIMQSASDFRPGEALHLQKSEVCATCHTLYTHALGPDGTVIGEFPEQVPYLEWKHSEFSRTRECQACHMAAMEQDTPITAVQGQPRPGFSRHEFRGGNFFMFRMLNRYRDSLGVETPSADFTAGIDRTHHHLETESARLSIVRASISSDRLAIELKIENLAGHKLPTAYPSRRAWVRLSVLDRAGKPVFESGTLRKDGSIAGNDNDADASTYEPHYTEIDSPGQVQVYETILADSAGSVTTGLIQAVRSLKDNRVLPAGFDKGTAHKDIAVYGGALPDDDFGAGGDRIRYLVPVAGAHGPFQVRADLLYQPIGFRWARNLGRQDVFEMTRFVSYYDSMAAESAALLARAAATVD